MHALIGLELEAGHRRHVEALTPGDRRPEDVLTMPRFRHTWLSLFVPARTSEPPKLAWLPERLLPVGSELVEIAAVNDGRNEVTHQARR